MAAEERLQGCLLGYSYRQKVVQDVRQQFEQVVSEVQPQLEEQVIWPSKNSLCYPKFEPRMADQDSVMVPLEDTPEMVGAEMSIEDSSETCTNMQDSQGQSDDKSSESSREQQHKGSAQEQVKDTSSVFKSLHKDGPALIEFRHKLGMELVWLKQAIASRQKYLQLKKEMELSDTVNKHEYS